jgi:transcriptional regulator with XRE-family HTH domain
MATERPPGERFGRRIQQLRRDQGLTQRQVAAELAGKLPSELRLRAQQDVEFARFLRRLPDIPDEDLQDIYRQLKLSPPET